MVVIVAKMAWHREGGIMVFTPTMEEFRNFPAFVKYMEEQGAHHHGIAKVRILFARLLSAVSVANV